MEAVSKPEQTIAPKPTKESISSVGKKTAKNKSKPLYFWSAADVNKWLKKHGGHYHQLYGELFMQQEITGRTLIRLNDIKLEKIGITSPDHRADLMRHILKLRLKHESHDLKTLDQKGTGFELKITHQGSKDIPDKHPS